MISYLCFGSECHYGVVTRTLLCCYRAKIPRSCNTLRFFLSGEYLYH